MIALAMAMALAGSTPVGQLSGEYLQALWQVSPMSASQAGYHQGDTDRQLDDLSAAARARRSAWLHAFGQRLAAAPRRNVEDRADADLLKQAVALELLEIDQAHDYARRCDAPIDALGSALFQMVARPYAPLDRRAADVVARLGEVGRYLDQAAAGLTTNVEIFHQAAKDDGAGLVAYLDGDLVHAFAGAHDAAAVRAAAHQAAGAVRAYLARLDRELPKLKKGSFRYDPKLYAERFGPYLQTDQTPAEVLTAAEKRMQELHREMAGLATQIVGHPDIRAALAKVAADHTTAAGLFDAARKDFEEARAFVTAHKLVTLEGQDNLKVVPTPPFLRSLLGVAAFDGAPPLEPKLGAFYYVTPLPPSWTAAQVESKLREYNRYMLDLVTVHEAMPGHYVQFEHANRVEPETRRVLRWVLGANSYIEGWAMYVQDLMVDAGYHASPAMRLTLRKLELRAVANSILDIRLHTRGMTDAQALSLMMNDAFQERAEAVAKLRRAKLSVTQLCSYFVGVQAWRGLRQAAQARPGFDLRRFHDRALDEGAVTLPMLRTLLLQ